MKWRSISKVRSLKYGKRVSGIWFFHNVGEGKLKIPVRALDYDTVMSLCDALDEEPSEKAGLRTHCVMHVR